MIAMRALVALALAACSAQPPKGETATPVHTAIPEPTEPGADTTGADLAPTQAKSDPVSPAPRLDAAVAKFLAAANSDDDAGAERASTPDCWSKECSSFAGQAGKKFQARVSGDARADQHRAVVPVDVVCPGERKCDFVHLLFEISSGAWLVADVTEDDAKAKAWIP